MRISFPAIAFLVFIGSLACAQETNPQNQDTKTAAEAFKNVQVLKRVPADQWFDTMAFIAGSLGVTCDHCHTSAFELDEGNAAKLKARQMMRMVDDINRANFDGKIVVTCNTCHRGALKPQAAPVPDVEHWKKPPEKEIAPPSAVEIFGRYRRAVGVASVKSPPTQSVSLQLETYGGTGPPRQRVIEVLLGENGRVRMTDHEGTNVKTIIRNGHRAWVNDAAGWRAMSEGEASTAFEAANVLAPDQVGDVTNWGAIFRDRVYGQPAYVVPVDSRDGRKWLFFDAGTGLLLRQRIFFSSFYADGSVDIEYADYRKSRPFLLPTTIRVVNAGGEGLTIRRMLSRKVNIKTNDQAFVGQGE